MKLGEALDNFQIYRIIQKVKNKKGKIKEYEIQLDDVNDGLDAEGKIGIRDVSEYLTIPIERLVFILNEVKEEWRNI